MEKVFAVSVELDDPPGDVESAQVRYLDGVLRDAGEPSGSGFAFRFQYDMDGTCHWDGTLYVIDVSDGRCALRYADYDDTGQRVYRHEQAQLRREARARFAGQAYAKAVQQGGVRGAMGLRNQIVIELERPFHELDGAWLHEAFQLMRVAAVMTG